MQIVLTPDQMRSLEKQAFSLGVPSLLLMENAAREAHKALSERLGGLSGKDILFLIGTGNNGGDGLAMARLCRLAGGKPRVVMTGAIKTEDAKANLGYGMALGIPVISWPDRMEEPALLPRPDAVVDAVYGTGFHGILPEGAAQLAGIVNSWSIPRIALDIPSGMDSLTGEIHGPVFTATNTLALGHLKTGHCLARLPGTLGRVQVLPLGIPESAYQALSPDSLLCALEAEDLVPRLPKRAANAHKGDNGRVLMYMGSMGLAGAAGMAAQAALACLRSGAGLVTVACEREIIPILQSLAPNATCVSIGDAVMNPPKYDVLAVGCGLGQSEAVRRNILALWDRAKPSVWDADALNLLAAQPMKLGEMAVLTPHPGEAARLLGRSTESVTSDLLGAAHELQRRYGGTVVLKSAVTILRNQAHTAVNLVGSPALAKGGSGDALAGIIAALLAQSPGVAPIEAAKTACLWHGMAGRLAAERLGLLSPLTGDVIECLGPVAVSN